MNFKRIGIVTTLLIIAVFAFFPLKANLGSEDKQELHKIIHEYIVNNPEVIKEALLALQKKEAESQAQATLDKILEQYAQLFNSEGPAIGADSPSVTVVEFFDYQCRYCKKMHEIITEIVKDNPDLKIVFKDLPILGGHSVTAAKYALAAQKQGKHQAFHDALMAFEDKLNDQNIADLAKEAGLDVEQLKQDMVSTEVEQALEENMKLAQSLGIRGIPALIVGPALKTETTKPVFIPGSVTTQQLQEAIDKVKDE